MSEDRLKLVEEIFCKALEVPPQQRSEFVLDACRSDPELLVEVQSLVTAHEEAEDFIKTPAFSGGAVELFAGLESQPLEGKQIGRYNIVSVLGRGGMGEVYLAEDSMLGRRVAIKVLPPNPGGSSARLERFVREARAASALNHANIITIYEIGQFDDSHYIAEELIEGETLRVRMARTQMAPRAALDVVVQVAAALAATHAAGIVHRDIKPENIMLRPDGVVKVLDFGLAKFTETSKSRSSTSTGAFGTNSSDETIPGTIMGTVTYMSPEQARGSAIDGRTDIFSLGVVLYEMICGRAPFAGETPTDTIAEIIKSEPEAPGKLCANMPSGLEAVILKALRKDQNQRYQTMDEMLADLRAVDQGRHRGGGGTLGGSLMRLVSARPGYAALLVLAAVAIGLAMVWTLRRHAGDRPTPNPALVRRTKVHEWKSEPRSEVRTARFSPDGKSIVFASKQNGKSVIFTKLLSAGAQDPVQITKGGRSDERSPIWSPDGQEIAYVSANPDKESVQVVPALGGSARSLTNLASNIQNIVLIFWSRSGRKIYYQYGNNIFALDIDSGTPSEITSFDPGHTYPFEFSVSPDEKWLAYVDDKNGQPNVWITPLGAGESRSVTNDPEQAEYPVWLNDGKGLIYSSKRDGVFQIYQAFLDGRNPLPVALGEVDEVICDVSADGASVLCTSVSQESDIWGVDAIKGGEFSTTPGTGAEIWPSLSADNRLLIFQTCRGNDVGKDYEHSKISVRPIAGALDRRQIVEDGFDPSWCPDGGRAAFLRTLGDAANIWTVGMDRLDESQVTTKGVRAGKLSTVPYTKEPSYSWSPDGSRLAYCSARADGLTDLYTIAPDGSNETNLTKNTSSRVVPVDPVWSPYGNGLAYVSYSAPLSAQSRSWCMCIADTDNQSSHAIFPSDTTLHVCGWVAGGRSLVVAQAVKSAPLDGVRTDVVLLEIHPGKTRQIARVPSAYLDNIAVSPDGKSVALVERSSGSDNIQVLSVASGRPHSLTNNKDPRLLISGFSWSPDGKTIYFGRQANVNAISVVGLPN
jgi:Tol biopolymer transport system component